MRVTIDLDKKNPITLFITLLKGFILYRKIPNYFRITKRGYHIGWIRIPISEHKMYVHRQMLGDDKKRILLDKLCYGKPKQTFFTHKNHYKLIKSTHPTSR